MGIQSDVVQLTPLGSVSGVIPFDELEHGGDGSASAIPHRQKLERWTDERR